MPSSIRWCLALFVAISMEAPLTGEVGRLCVVYWVASGRVSVVGEGMLKAILGGEATFALQARKNSSYSENPERRPELHIFEISSGNFGPPALCVAAGAFAGTKVGRAKQ
ncbi:hypothetical protein Emag_005637 [Eimeria magna]